MGQMIFRHYRELVRPADAEKWLAVALTSVEEALRARETRSGKAGNAIDLATAAVG